MCSIYLFGVEKAILFQMARLDDEVGMNLKEKIESLLQQGALYRSQGLVDESLSKYSEAIKLLEMNKKIKNRGQLIKGIRGKMQAAKAELEKFEKADDSPEISSKIQDLIKKQFAFSNDEDSAALEGAVALVKFGQFQRALEEFEKLLERDTMRVDAAKNIIRCHRTLFSLDKAVEQFKVWMAGNVFEPIQLNKVRVFFEATLERAGMDIDLPEPGKPTATADPPPVPEAVKEPALGEPVIEMPDIDTVEPEPPGIEMPEFELPEMEDDEILDINSIGFTPETGPQKGKMIEFNVSFQTGDVISVLIPGKDKEIIDYFQDDFIIENVQYYSPMAIFNGSGKVFGKTKIESGPRRGHYSVDIKVITS